MNLNAVLRSLREGLAMSQADMAKLLGVPQQSYGKYEISTKPPHTVLGILVKKYPISPKWLLTGNGEDIDLAIFRDRIDGKDGGRAVIAAKLGVPQAFLDLVASGDIVADEQFYKKVGGEVFWDFYAKKAKAEPGPAETLSLQQEVARLHGIIEQLRSENERLWKIVEQNQRKE